MAEPAPFYRQIQAIKKLVSNAKKLVIPKKEIRCHSVFKHQESCGFLVLGGNLYYNYFEPHPLT